MIKQPETTDLALRRERMVDEQLIRRGIQDPGVLAAMRQVRREQFVPTTMIDDAYADGPLPIEAEQTISQPFVVALMLQAAVVKHGDRVLEVGTGSGYAAALLSRLAAQVYTIERHAGLADSAASRLRELGYANVEVRHGDGTDGWPEAQPFDAILVAAAGPRIPEALKQQLEVGGRLVMPVGIEPDQQRLVKLLRRSDGFAEKDLGSVRFVPLVGRHGWTEEDAAAAGRRRD